MSRTRHLARGSRLFAAAAAILVPLVGGVAAPAPPASAATTVHVAVHAGQGLGTIPAAAFGMNTAVYDGYMNDAPIPDLMRSAGIGALRYPGGSYADIYRWQDNTAPGGYVAPNTDFDSFMATVNAAGAQPVIIANYGTGTPQEAADWVRYANITKGYHAKYWEIGNEVYGNGHYGAQWEQDDHADKSPTAYANNLLEYVSAMKAVDPSIKIGAVLTTPGYWPDGIVGSGDSADWNHTVLSIAGKQIDFVVVHWYPGGSSAADMLTTASTIPDEVYQIRSLVDQYAGSHAPNVGIAVTETNSSIDMDTQPAALFAPDTYMTWLENGVFNVDWWNEHNGIGTVTTVDGATDYGDQGVLSNGSCSGGVCEPAAETPFASYYGIKMLTRLGSPGDQMVAASSDQPLVAAHAVRRKDGDLDVLLINKDPSDSYMVDLSYTGFTAASGAPTVYSFTRGASSIASDQRGSASTQTIPPYSLTTIRLHPSGGGGVTGPSAPGQPTASDVTTTSATLSWPASTPGTNPISGYDVYQGSDSGSTRIGTTTSTSFQVTGLRPGTAYTFNVVAKDTAGNLSPPSPPVTFTTATPTNSTCSVSYTKRTDWGSGFVADLVITNRGSAAIDGWTLRFDFPLADQKVSNGWGGAWSQSGTTVTVADAGWNATIPANGGTVQVGFSGGYTGANPVPTAFTLNGTACAVD